MNAGTNFGMGEPKHDLSGMEAAEIIHDDGRVTRGRVVLKNGAVYEG